MTGLAEYQKAFIGPYRNGHMELKDGFYVPFNPAEISIEEAIGTFDVSAVGGAERVDWMQRGHTLGMQYPVGNSLSRQERNLTTLSATLFFNTLYDLYQTSYEDVRDDIRKLYPYTNTTENHTSAVNGGKRNIRKQGAVHKAQQIYFFWGTIAVAGMLKQMRVNYTMFAPDGKPVRAQVGISIEGFYVGEEAAAKSASGGKAVSAGDAAMQDALSQWKASYRGGPNPRKEY